MITNDYIYSRCKEKLVRPTISISEISLGNSSNYSRPYGQVYLPTPIIDFPAGVNFEVCVRNVSTLNGGIPFKFFLPEGFDTTGIELEVMLSGDKYFSGVVISFTSSITQINVNFYKTDTDLGIWWRSMSLAEWKSYGNLSRSTWANAKRYFRMRITDGIYFSAWSQIGSFTYKVRFAESGIEGYKEDGTLITDEEGYVYDGTFYY